MPSLKDLKNRINSVKSTRKITSAMKLVAAAKLKRAQDAAEASRPYAERMADMTAALSAAAKDSPTAPALLVGTGKEDVHLLVVATAERGLCGGFNSTIVRLARTRIRELLAAGKTVKIMTIGKKGREQLVRDYRDLMVHHVDLSGVKKVGYADAQAIADQILDRFAKGEFDVCTLFYNRFQSVISQIPTPLQLIPAATEQTEETGAADVNYEYEPDEEALLKELLPKALTVGVFRALLENAASEQGARMAAMDNATRNAGELIKKLTLEYNRSRQAAITKELIEIISGAEAL
ncbi:MAG: F0F1 ATP synthase subunit gamma [Pseudomonadota bacterium]